MTQKQHVSKEEMIRLFKRGSDVIIHLGTETYDEKLPIRSIFISDDHAWGLVDHHIALPFERPSYNVFLNYELDNNLTILRTKHLVGDGAYGGMFGLPDCKLVGVSNYTFYEWVAIDRFTDPEIHLTPKMIVDDAIRVKLRITTDDFTIITDPSIIISYNGNTDGGFSIRTQRIGIPYVDGLGIADIEIMKNVMKVRERYLNTGIRFRKMLQVFGITPWKKSCREIRDFRVDFLVPKYGEEREYRFVH